MDPMTMLSIGQSVVGYIGAKNKAAEDEARYRANRVAAVTARDLKIQSLNRRAIQEAESIAGQKMDLAIQALETRESQVVTSGEAGVSGSSVEQQLDMTESRKLRGDTIYNDQLGLILQQLEDEKQGADAEAMNQIYSLPRGQEPSFIAAAAGAAANAYSMERQVAGRGKGSFLDSIGLGGPPSPKSSSSFVLPSANLSHMPAAGWNFTT